MVVRGPYRHRTLHLLAAALLLVSATGCDRPVPDDPATTRPVPVMEGPGESDRDFGLSRTDVGRNEPTATTRSAEERPTIELDIGGRQVPFPPPDLRLSADATAVLLADAEARADLPPNTLYLQMVPVTDGERPWMRAVWTYRLTSAELLPTQGLFIGSSENQLRPVRVEVEIIRRKDDPSVAEVTLDGLFVPADAADPLTADGYTVRGEFRVRVVGP